MPKDTLTLPEPSKFQAWAVVLSSALFFFYIFIQMNLFNAVSPALMKEFHFSASEIGQIYAFYSYANIICVFPAGILLDRFSIKKTLLLSFIISTVALYLFSTTSQFWVMNATRLLCGVAGSFCFLASVKLASRWFKPEHMAVAIGVVVTMAMLGGAVAQTPLAILTDAVGWRMALQLVAVLGVVLMIIQLLIIRDYPKGTENYFAAQRSQLLDQIGFWPSLKMALGNIQNWLSGIYISLINLPMFVLSVWGTLYLVQEHGLTRILASTATMLMFVGLMIGSPLAGWISDKVGRRKIPMIVGAILSILVILALMFTPTMPVYAELALYFVLGIIISAQVIGYPVIAESNPPAITATATGIASLLIFAAGALLPLFGWLLEFSGDKQIVDSVSVYSAHDFMLANSLMLGGVVIALICSFFIKETYCKAKN